VARFQALTNAVLDEELERLREEMGLRDNQKAELLRELALVTAWVVGQLRAGRVVEARGPQGVEVFRHPALRRPSQLPNHVNSLRNSSPAGSLPPVS
jgi:hypothetical protein